MLIRKPADIKPSEITPESVFLNRRQFMAGSAAATATAALAGLAVPGVAHANQGPKWLTAQIKNGPGRTLSIKDEITPYEDATQYNNFYEFGFDKRDPARRAKDFKTDPWTVEVSGEVVKPGKIQLEDLIKPHSLEERVYRFRCVEAWSMVVPWVGFSLSELIKRFEPTKNAKYVEFKTLVDPEQMPGQKQPFGTIDWPYLEGLRMDEAMHPLTFMAVGMYGQVLPNQNGAPLRLVVPWKYGFKSIKSIVSIRLTEQMPRNTWNQIAPQEYGFYANVNPEVDHPRWSQGHERRLPSGLFSVNRIPTQKFNGYGDEVASLYSGMDLSKFY